MLARQALLPTARLSSVDGCRGLAAILVVLLHASETVGKQKYFGIDPAQGWLQFGVRGVDFFFVLSGFVIAYAHWPDLGRPGRLANYGLKRFVRLYPPYLAFTIPLVVLSWMIRTDNLPTSLPAKVVASAGTLALVPTSYPPILGTAWTLEHEVLFYLLFGLLLIHVRSGLAVMAVWGVLCALNLAVGFRHHWLTDFLFRPYNLEFLFGLAAGMFLRVYRVPRPAAWLAGGVALFATGALLYNQGYFAPIDERMPYTAQRFYEWQLLVSGASSACIILGLSQLDLDGRTAVYRLPSLLGAASYSIYLTHLPVISVACKALRHTNLGSTAAWCICLTAGVGSGLLFHFAVERHVVAWAREKLLPAVPAKPLVSAPSAAMV